MTTADKLLMNTDLPERAHAFALRAHGAQKRNYTEEPYAVHLVEVARLVTSVGAPDAVVAAAYLHDVLEDTATSVKELRAAFGDTVTKLVLEVTDVSTKSDGNRAARKKLDREHVGRASHYGKTIKLADIISNSRTIVKHDPAFAKVYLPEKAALLMELRDGDATLYGMALLILHRAEKELKG